MVSNILAAILLFTLALFVELWSDLRDWKKGIDIRHRIKPLERFMMLIPSFVLFATRLPLWALPVVVLMVAFAWWLLFDGLYNVRRGFSWWFNGSHEGKKDDSFLDKILRRMSDKQEKRLKIGGLLLSILIYILL